jgi:sn-glycerol 3-phosphate transport system permease protein
MAAVVVVILPTLLLLFLGQKRLQKGLTQGAIK